MMGRMHRFDRRPVVVVVALATVGAAFGGGFASSAHGWSLAPSPSPVRRLVVKFRDESGLRVRRGRVVARVATSSVDASSSRVASDAAVAVDAVAVGSVLDAVGAANLRPLFALPEADLDALHTKLEATTGTHMADQNAYVTIDVPSDRDLGAVIRIVGRLPAVESVDLAPEPAPLPSPLFTSAQRYLVDAAQGGIDVAAVAAVPGGRGSNVRFVDLEYSWNTSHEDVDRAALPGALIPMGVPADPFFNPANPMASMNHGTAVLGVVAADDDAQGVTGIAPDVDLHMTNTNTADGYAPASAIALALQQMSAGDVMLIEQQAVGPNGCNSQQFGCVPIEWYESAYTAIKAATAAGIIVVEAAGNGSQDLSAPPFAQPFPEGRGDSGAIIVGAGSVTGCTGSPRSRLWFSNHGGRVDVQGWGECVVTTGYGSLFSGGPNALYANSFSGTSSASAMVAAVAAVVSSVAQQQHVVLSPIGVRALLVSSGRPGPAGADIGPLPDLAAAMQAFVPSAVLLAPAVVRRTSSVTFSAAESSDPQGGTLSYAWSLDDDGLFDDGSGPSVTRSAAGAPRSWPVAVRVTDPFGASATARAMVSVEDHRDDAPAAPPAVSGPTTTIDLRAPAPEGAPTGGTTRPRISPFQ